MNIKKISKMDKFQYKTLYLALNCSAERVVILGYDTNITLYCCLLCHSLLDLFQEQYFKRKNQQIMSYSL